MSMSEAFRARAAISLLLTACIFWTTVGAAKAQEGPETASVTLTAKDSPDRLASKGTVRFTRARDFGETSDTVIVDPTRHFQRIEGIGGALTDAAAESFYKLPPAGQQALLTAYFDPVKGIGYTLGRTHINSCDFSSESYMYDETPGDLDLRHFTIAHDLKYRIPFIKRILAMVPGFKLFASPWSPPAWMKTNNDVLHGGKLKPECYDAWARYYIRFIQEYASQGIPIWGLTVQNEPAASQSWESCIYSAEDERDFVRDHLGPALEAANLSNVKLMIWDHNRGPLYMRASTVLEDPVAARYVWGVAFHWYMNDAFANVREVARAFPGKAVMLTEACNYPFSWEHFNDWKWSEKYGRAMVNDFNNGSVGWTDWNVLLDEKGGPNHVANYCFAPIHADTRDGTLHFMNAYYYIGHFSRFVRPGAHRIACSVVSDDLLATAFQNANGRVATILMNETEAAKDVTIWVKGRAVHVALPPHAIATVTWHGEKS